MSNPWYSLKLSVNTDTFYSKKGSEVIIISVESQNNEFLILKNLYSAWWLSFVKSTDVKDSISSLDFNYEKDRLAEIEVLIQYLVIHKYLVLESGEFNPGFDEKKLNSNDYVMSVWEEFETDAKSYPIFAQYGDPAYSNTGDFNILDRNFDD